MNDRRSPPDPIRQELRRAHLFAEMDEVHLRQLAASAQEVRLEAGDTLLRHGEPAERFFYLREGLIKLFRLSPPRGTRRSSSSSSRARPSPRR